MKMIWGSPPHMRGKAPPFALNCPVPGITPAHAGKRIINFYEEHIEEDHPRTCGEKEARQWPKEQVWGSPPHMRGKDSNKSGKSAPLRITPAHAGKSL